MRMVGAKKDKSWSNESESINDVHRLLPPTTRQPDRLTTLTRFCLHHCWRPQPSHGLEKID